MFRVFGQLVKAPLEAFVYATEMVTATMQGLQRIAGQSVDLMIEALSPQGMDTKPSAPEPATEQLSENTNPEEESDMKSEDCQDLSGDDLKYVSYAILFTKRDLEVTLEEKKQEVVNYSTNAGSFGGLKIAEFMAKVERGQIPRPQIWIDNDYPPDRKEGQPWKIPEQDKKYITFVYQVERSLPRQHTEYEREKVRELRRIREELERTHRKIGP